MPPQLLCLQWAIPTAPSPQLRTSKLQLLSSAEEFCNTSWPKSRLLPDWNGDTALHSAHNDGERQPKGSKVGCGNEGTPITTGCFRALRLWHVIHTAYCKNKINYTCMLPHKSSYPLSFLNRSWIHKPFFLASEIIEKQMTIKTLLNKTWEIKEMPTTTIALDYYNVMKVWLKKASRFCHHCWSSEDACMASLTCLLAFQ